MSMTKSDLHLNQWKTRQELAEIMIPLVGEMYRERGIVAQVYGRRLMNSSSIDLLKAHRYARQLEG